mmetsp:Transcript_68771/g.76953  ORF Transcript_68771/g.76953 Transcript_68771/m.76953 type:complete len:536 (-) Transcript_68771:260-1867(-)|eukprot:CAMPEP_0170811276 /NCGR_PEP_ID=MMETSP0733-20121128/35167_1 /TAXON_ID=186038 /ORGANISM="Fragilariopsis kerguelensis, Strain L26-C5" /LENGTH=535 /DNA_ID=CAMNT_0011167413 /DNA_START=145 /DNA_END=1752 /DNA_ORIENTATION=-
MTSELNSTEIQQQDDLNSRKHELARLRMHQSGIFPSYDSDDSNDEEKDSAEITHHYKVKYQDTFILDGTKVTAKSTAMNWKKFGLLERPNTTHELTIDGINEFDTDHVYVSGMTKNVIARVNKEDQTKQDIFHFPDYPKGRPAQPHTLRFSNVKSESNKGILWVGLEEQGVIVKLDMNELLKTHSCTGNNKTVELSRDDYKDILDVHIPKCDAIPTPINTRPHGFCFDVDAKWIWFTGKLTNTVGRILVEGDGAGDGDGRKHHIVEHFGLPTLGAVPIYVALGPDNNIWGTCLYSSKIFRVTTEQNIHRDEHSPTFIPRVHEIPISAFAETKRPITIKSDPRSVNDPHNQFHFMWFTNEASHSVCRLDVNAFEKVFNNDANTKGQCVCSIACKLMFNIDEKTVKKIIHEFQVPKFNSNMKLGGLAMSNNGTLWVQSHMEPTKNDYNLPDYIIRIQNVPDFENRVEYNLTGLPVDYFKLPSRNTVLHRIIVDPQEPTRVWFTEMQQDRIGTITAAEENCNGKNGGGNKKRSAEFLS